MCEDKSYLWLEKVTDKDIKEEDLKVHLLNNQEIKIEVGTILVYFGV